MLSLKGRGSQPNDLNQTLETGDKTEKGEEDKLDETVDDGIPMDSGWSWVIAFSAFFITVLAIGFGRSLSVLFVDISREFDKPASVTALIFTVHFLASGLTAVPFANMVMPRFSVRTLAVVTSLVSATATIISSFSPNIIVVLLLFTIKGVTFQNLIIGPLSLIGRYFKKRKALASSLVSCGICFSNIAFPPITEVLRREYGLRGTLLMVGAIELHEVVFSLLLRPPESYTKLHANRLRKLNSVQLPPIYRGPSEQEQISTSNDRGKRAAANKHHIISEPLTELPEKELDEENGFARQGLEPDPAVHSSNLKLASAAEKTRPAGAARKTSFHEEDSSAIVSSSYVSIDPQAKVVTRQRSVSEDESSAMLPGSYVSNDVQISLSSSPVYQGQEMASYHSNLRKADMLERQSSLLSAVSHTDIIGAVAIVEDDSVDDDQDKKKTCSCKIDDFIDVSLFKIWRFRLLMVFTWFSVYSAYLVTYLPAIGYTSGLNESQAALLLTLSGVMDLVTRLVLGYIGDFKWFSKSKAISFSLFVIAGVSHVPRFLTNFTYFLIFALVVGAFTGVRQNFMAVMVMDCVGVDKFTKGFAFVSTCATISISLAHPVIGALLDATGSFYVPLHIVGAILFLTAILLFFEPFFKNLDKKREAKEEQELDKAGDSAHDDEAERN